MSKVQLRIRDLRTGRTDLHEVPDVETAIGWLRARPPFVEVLGVQPEGITREEDATMRAALRPLDEAERDASRKLDEAADRAAELRAEEQRRKASEAERAHREATKNAPPDRPMELLYRFNRPELSKTDPVDERPITDEAKDAVMAWVAERMEWVVGRGQTVGEAKVTVYPAAVPAGKERVVTGSFVPVTAPKKGEN